MLLHQPRVEQPEDADRPLRDEVDDVLVVLVLDEVPLDLLADVRLLLELEDMLDEDDVDLTAWLNGDWVSQGSD